MTTDFSYNHKNFLGYLVKKLFFTLITVSSLFGTQAQIYTGAGYGYVHEQLSGNSEKSASSNEGKFKIGYGVRDAYAVEFSFSYIDNSSALLSADDKEKYGFDVELMKAWDLHIYALPFIRVGFGSGKMKSSARDGKNVIYYGSYNGSAGLILPLSENFDIELAYEYKNLSYQKVNPDLSSYDRSDIHTLYSGVNFRF